jgi:hypothetical protein
MSLSKHPIPPSYAWLTVFIPALAYFLGSRLQDTRLSGRSMGALVQNQLSIEQLMPAQKIFYLDSKAPTTLLQGLNLVHHQALEGVVDTIWKHDEDLGRGYLLLSQSVHAGRIWRWEVGGGPIAIGKTLHMDPSGCRSKHHLWRDCSTVAHGGSGGLAMDFGSKHTSAEGRLVLAEWGEQRIVRMEESGARTPLIVQVPSLCAKDETQKSQRRIHQPNSLLYTTYGDLIVADFDVDCQQAALYYLDNAMAIPPLESTWESRRAHEWNTTQNHDIPVKIFYSAPGLTAIGGLALDLTWKGLYAMVKVGSSIQALHLFLNDDDDEPLWDSRYEVVYEWNTEDADADADAPGPIVVDQGGNLYVGFGQTLFVLTSQGTIIASLELPSRATSLTLGQDGFLYVSSATYLYRMMVRSQPLKVPTNLVVKKNK